MKTTRRKQRSMKTPGEIDGLRHKVILHNYV